MASEVPAIRIRTFVDASINEAGDYVLYWMIANRRLVWNHALDRAVEMARSLEKPLLIFEALRVGYPWAADRHHQMIIDGMAHHRARLDGLSVTYYPYVEPEEGAGKGLLQALAGSACAVVTDDTPTFFIPKMLRAASAVVPCRMEAVDSCGLLPLRAASKGHAAAYHFRRFLHKTLPEHLGEAPRADPLGGVQLPELDGVPDAFLEQWPPAHELLADEVFWRGDPTQASAEEQDGRDPTKASGPLLDLSSLPIDHSVTPTATRGGHGAARRRLDDFLADGLERYAEDRNDPDSDAASRLSPWLHYGHISAHEVFSAVAEQEDWSPQRISGPPDGRRKGWWGMSEAAESFIDELVTWRELGYGFCYHESDYASYESLPEWARETLEAHAGDEREHVYSLEELDSASTDDEIWNAAQRQLVHDGVIQNYLRMLWGKNILAWTEHPRDALDIMIELNNRYALDGRDPNSYSGIFWVMGRFDRGWPEREVYGKVRTMTSRSTRKKLKLDRYLERWGAQGSLL
ncbi:MAG: deoxyribodipyrimidine photolyase [Gemmatimonadetes bacterium]|nr:deoxyribodipyrimidine photolyase [Gemmatimonadota bacterium]